MKIYGAEVKALRKKERQDEIQLTAKIGGKFCLDPSLFRFVKFSFPIELTVKPFDDALLCRNWPFSPPNRVTLLIITLVSSVYYSL